MAKDKVAKVMGEYKRGTLHSGSKKGPKVKSRKQAVAIAMSEAGKSYHDKMMKSAHGSDEFSKSDMDRGYKTMCSSTQLHEMDEDRLHNVEEWTMANRRNGTHMSGSGRMNLHRQQD